MNALDETGSRLQNAPSMDGTTGEARDPDLLLTMRSLMPSFSNAHRRIAEMMVADPHWAIQSNVDALAARAQVATPTIVRFTRAIGCEGLKDFKLKLAGTLALGANYLHRSVRNSDTPDEVLNNVVGSTLSALAEWHRSLDPELLTQAAAMLNTARRVDCYGTGQTSHFLGQDLQARLFRLGLTSTVYTDAYLQLVAAMTLTQNDVVVAISFVGRMPNLLETITTAKAQGARIIAITRRATPLAKLADIVLGVDVSADATMPVGTDAYITQAMMIEILTILLGRMRGPECIRRLEQIHKLLKTKDQDIDESAVVHWGWKNQL